MLNISIFHEKATGKEEKSSQETFWSPLQQIKESLSLQLRGPRCSFPAWNALLQEVCYCPHVLQKEISSAESYHYSLWFCLFPYFFMVTESFPPFESSLISYLFHHIGNSLIQGV